MILSKNIISVAITLVAGLCLNVSNAQDSKGNGNENKTSDSLMLAMHTSGPVFSEITTIVDNTTPVPFIKPTNNIYKTWNNKDIKLSTDKAFNKKTTYILPLLTENDHTYIIPCKGKIISPFGYRGGRVHSGTDIKLALNDEVYAAFDGEVRMAKRYSGYGNLVVIRHKNGLETYYGHLNAIKVKINQEVKAGDLIGLGGRTGRASTTHLHFETRFMGDAFNSAKLFDYDNFTLKSDTMTIDKNTFIKSKKFVYKRNKNGKRIRVSIKEPVEELISTNNTTVFYQDQTANTTPSFELNTATEPSTMTEKTETISKKKAVTPKKATSSYKVRKGDTLSQIARNNGTSIKKICEINHLKENAILSLGKTIKLK